ncbi:MAG: AAA family ATPase [Bacteroidetes bacterium]|nr:AAA family ATPase [Bacteroidota bacterium]
MEQLVAPENPMDFIILCGAAGTGKTSITAALIGFLGHLKQPYRISAPTGRAARILGRKANTTTSTIHAMIYAPSTDRESGKVTFKLKHGNNAKPTIYIIDEASMVSKEIDQEDTLFKVERGLIFDLIAYIKGANSDNKIIFIGDRYQLPPIGEDTSHALRKSSSKTHSISVVRSFDWKRSNGRKMEVISSKTRQRSERQSMQM